MTRSIEILVHPDGRIVIEAAGFAGPDCEKATAFLEQALGLTTDRRRKPEYHKRAQTRTPQRIGR